MGYELNYIVESTVNVQKLWDAQDFQKTYNALSLWHEFKGECFVRRQFDFGQGVRGWQPMLLLIQEVFKTNVTEYISNDNNWRKETKFGPKMLRLTNPMINELWISLKTFSILHLEQEAQIYSENIKDHPNNYKNWKINMFDYIELEYMELFKATQLAQHKHHEMLLTIQ